MRTPPSPFFKFYIYRRRYFLRKYKNLSARGSLRIISTDGLKFTMLHGHLNL